MIVLCQVCGARVKTKDTLKQHRKKLHNLVTPVPKTALINEETVRTVENPGVIMTDQRPEVVGLNQTEDPQRIVGLSNLENMNSTVSHLDHRLMGAINVLPKL